MSGPLDRALPSSAEDGSALKKIVNLVYAAALTGALALDATYPEVLVVDPGGADRNITLDNASAAVTKYIGLKRVIKNGADAQEILTVLAEDGTTTLVKLQPGDVGVFFCYSTGWALIEHRKGTAYEEFTLAGDITVDGSYPEVCKMDPDGSARNVTLDNDSTDHSAYIGKRRRIINGAGGAENLVVKAEDGTTTIGTINQNEQGEFYCANGGWALICISTIALS